MRKLLGIIALVVGCLPAIVLGQPQAGSVSGSFSHGETVTLSGAHFGVKSPAAPYIYDNFDAGSPGENISGGWHIDSTKSNQRPRYSDSVVRNAGLLSAFQDFSNGNYNCTIGLTNLSVGKMYMSGWFYNTTSGNQSRNFKLLSFRGGNAGQWDLPNGRMDMYPSTSSGHQYIADCDGAIPEDTWGIGANLYSGAWHRIESWMDHGTVGQSNGEWEISRDLNTWSRVEGTFMADEECHYTNFYIAAYFADDGVGTPRPEMEMYWDELYVDLTQARIEIGDNINWSACTHREIQIPTQWNDNSASFMVNIGTFEPGDLVYVFLVDEDGQASEIGAPIIIGTSGGSEMPGPPGTPVRIPEGG